MTRPPDWPERLAVVLADWHAQPFVWGRADCAHFALACLQAVSGRDWYVLELPRYHDARSAARALKKLNARSVAGVTAQLLGPAIPASALGRGDLALVDGALGVCAGEKIWALCPTGLTALPRSSAQAGWRV